MQIGELARATGVTVRTLHHWEQVGLVRAARSRNGYRDYDDSAVARVRSVAAWRELGLGLDDIGALLADGVTNAQLEAHRDRLAAEAGRLAATAAAVTRALEARRMGIELDPAEVRAVFGDDDPSQHAAEAQERWGDTDAYRESQRRTSGYRKEDWLRMRAEQEDLEQRMAAAMAAGADGVALALEHQQLVSRWFYACDDQQHLALAELYVGDARFQEHYDSRAPGLAAWLRNAIVAAHPGALA
jgi:DNA-binding transcriptional MerR regulator